jgi:hypothetical protein
MSVGKQLLLDIPCDAGARGEETSAPRFSPIHVSSSTFKAGLSTSIHRWFRLTPSYGPDLVREMLSKLNAATGDYVLDPFSGASTTSIECGLEGFDSAGFEVNPLLHFVGQVSTNWKVNPDTVRAELTRIVQEFKTLKRVVTFDNIAEYNMEVPPIHNPMRWWRADVLTDILILKNRLLACPDKDVRDFFRLCLAGVLVPDLTNVTLGKLQLHFIDRTHDEIDALTIFVNHAENMLHDLGEVRKLEKIGRSEILLQDSTKADAVSLQRKVDCVITSPPYPNRYSYVWNTRPHLYMLDFIATGKSATQIDQRTIGGTWGTATSELAKGIIPPVTERIGQIVEPIASLIREEDNLMANYAMHYFNRLATHLTSIDHLLSDSARAAYVVGNSRLKGVYIETDVLLGKIFEALGLKYTVTDIHRFRRRNSGKDLFESIVYVRKKS